MNSMWCYFRDMPNAAEHQSTTTSQDQKVKLGEAGELLVASRFLAHGLIAGQLPRGYRSDDLYVERGDEIIHIQVKTRVGPKSWPVGHNIIGVKNRYYALVHFNSMESVDLMNPVVYLVPSLIVKEAVEIHTHHYLHAHPNQEGPGVPTVADPWRMQKEMTEAGYGTGWLDDRYREAWATFIAEQRISSAEAREYIYEALRDWRLDKAQKTAVQLYIICTNRTIEELAAKQPQTKTELLEIYGLGAKRIETYGDEILEIIRVCQTQ